MTSMKKRSFLTFGLLCVAVVALGGCGGKVHPQLKLQAGDSHTLKVTSDVQGGDQQFAMQVPATYVFDVESVDAAGQATVEVTVTEAEVPGLEGMESMEGMPLGLGDLSKLMEAFSLEGKSFTMTLNPDGSVGSVTGMNAAANEVGDAAAEAISKMFAESPMLKGLAQGEGGAQMTQMLNGIPGMMKKMVREMMGDDTMRENMELLFMAYPAEPIGTGDSWERTLVRYKQPPMVLVETYTLKERKDGMLFIDCMGEILANESAKPVELFMGMKISAEYTGTQSGAIRLDEETGWPVTMVIEQDLEGKVDKGFGAEQVTLDVTARIEAQ